MTVEQNIRELEHRIAAACERRGRSSSEVTIVAVTKTIDVPSILAAARAGIVHFGESRVQEAKAKIEELRATHPGLTWHMVGHLQTNKVKTAVDIFDIIHSVDSIRLAETISQRATKTAPILIQVNVWGEATKSGFEVAEVSPAVEQIGRLPMLELKGLMTIAPLVNDAEEVRPCFRRLRQLRDALGLEHLSMGMSDDFEVAIEEGATMVRIGRAIFGQRSA